MNIEEKKKRKEQAITLMEIAFSLLDGIRETQADSDDLWQAIKALKEDDSL